MRILITGEHDGLPPRAAGLALDWVTVDVLDFEPLDTPLPEGPWDWILFTSPRAVAHWNGGAEGAHVGCMGKATAAAARAAGLTVAFQPEGTGSEAFLDELTARFPVAGKRILLPSAEGGRTFLAERLSALGATATQVPVYRSRPRRGITVPRDVEAVVVTSPSSLEALLMAGGLPQGARVFCLGSFTEESLRRHGVEGIRRIPAGDLARIGEVL